MPAASRSIEINAPRERVLAVITDYDRYAEFLPEVKKVSTSDRQGDEVQVHYEVDVIKRIQYTLKMRAEPPGRVSWSFVRGDFMKDNHGNWQLDDLGNGRTRATYTIEMSVGALVPKALLSALVEKQLPSMLEAFRKRAEAMP